MKTTKLTLFVLLLAVTAFSQTGVFRLGYTGMYPEGNTYHASQYVQYNWYDELSLNTWQGFGIGDNHAEVLVKLEQYGYNGMFEIDTLKWLAFGRYDIIEAEETANRFRYNTHRCGSPEQDNTFGGGNWVMYYNKNSLCNEEQSPQGLVLSGLNENGIYSFGYQDPRYECWITGDSVVNTWYIKPRIRINQSDAFSDPPKNVCKIIVKAYNGDTVSQTIIQTNRFRDITGSFYNGEYLEEFYQLPITVLADMVTGLNQGHPGYHFTNQYLNSSQVDFQIYWYGNVSMWIDCIKIVNRPAELLFGNTQEARDVKNALFRKSKVLVDRDGANNKMMGFYTEEIEYMQLRCLKRVQDFLDSCFAGQTNKVQIYSLLDWDSYHLNLKSFNRQQDYQQYIDWLQPPFLMEVYYVFVPGGILPQYPSYYSQRMPDNISFVDQSHYPRLVTMAESTHVNSFKTNKSTYNNVMQRIWDDYADTLSFFHNLSNDNSISYVAVPAYSNWRVCNCEGLREPMNSEIGVMTGIALCRGTKGIMPYLYQTGYAPKSYGADYYYGMTDIDTAAGLWGSMQRVQNFYGEPKWNYVETLNSNIKNHWGPIAANSESTAGYSVVKDGVQHEYIQDILSIDPNRQTGIQNPCVEDYPLGPYMDCGNERFWEMGFFSTTEPNTKYFMMVNRRCVPELNGYHGDDRVLKIKFNLSGPVGWYISEVGSMAAPILFNKNNYVDLGNTAGSMGWFEPGEAKMFKLQPMIIKGGTMIADEVISGGNFTCEAPVYNNGYNITIEAGTTIHFNDSSRFVMNGGTFTVGNQNVSGSQNITCDAVNGTSWRGHSFTNCEVKIYGASFAGISNDTAYSLNIVDCPVVDIRNCTFNSAQSLKGAVNAVFYNNPFAAISNVYLYGNTFNSSGSSIPTVNISSYAGLTLPLIIEGNTFNNGNTAIFLTGVTGGAIKGNTITDNYYGLNVLTSSVDIFENTISSSVNGSIGIFSAGGSEIRLNKAGSLLIGGQNTITNTGSASNNIKVEGAVFLLADGENVFDIASNQSAYHLYGWFPYFTAVSYDETDNCFKVDNSPVDPPVNLVTDGYQGSALSFTFQPYLAGCEISDGGDGFAINLGDGIYDTLYNSGSGSGGSYSSSKKIPLSRGVSRFKSGRGVFVLSNAKQRYDSISVLLRYRNYPLARTKCIDLINTYPDSIQSLNAISKLFLTSTASDTTINGASQLKIYYENLILNNPNNVSLVKRANYFILKCKVRMRQYSQALAGFQQIINQNPYSYEGLIARWDYMATSLLLQGSSGGFPSPRLRELDAFDPDDLSDEASAQSDKNPFTKEQRQDIRKSINTAIEISKSDDETKMKTLEQLSQLGDVNASRELSQMNSLKQVVKTEKPKNILQHVRIISEDIRKVFGESTSASKINPNNIPTIYRLSQNYPNPFNPVTKINYDLPRDAKVTIIIYDILGREVKRLVNNEIKKAGAYIVDFNALNYATGVYFYRIEAEETGGFKFVDSKKMVLLK